MNKSDNVELKTYCAKEINGVIYSIFATFLCMSEQEVCFVLCCQLDLLT